MARHCTDDVRIDMTSREEPVDAALPRPDHDAVLRRRAVRVGYAGVGLAGLTGACGVAGWVFDVAGLRKILPELAPLRFNTALSILLMALTWVLPRLLRWSCAAVVALIALVTLAEYAFGVRDAIDQLLFTDTSGGRHPGRMAIDTALSFLLLAAARLLADLRRRAAARWLGVAVALIAGLTVLGYIYNASWLYRIRPVSTTTLQPAVALVLLGGGVVLTLPSRALNWSLGSQDAGAVLVRRVLPVALVGLPIVGALAVAGERHGLYDATTAAAGIVVSCALIMAAVTLAAAQRLARIDSGRARALAELTALKTDLERQVAERAGQLHRRGQQIAVLQDRQRIAADLHDIVIQRLFAAGMFLQGGVATATDAGTRSRIDAAVEAMDAAIKDLRTAIFELNGPRPLPLSLATAVEGVCAESARVLGFMPALAVDDLGVAADGLREELLAVLREALANVARHARASAVQVRVQVGDGVVRLLVRDDGVGMPPTGRASGTQNMLARARQRGGDCTWTSVQPHGTEVDWRVPLPET